MSTELRFTVADFELLPLVEGNRYEIIDGELYVSKQPRWHHQVVCGCLAHYFIAWDPNERVGVTITAPGIIFAEDQAMAPDLVWISRERFGRVAEPDGKLHLAPDLVVEVLSPGSDNVDRDRTLKLKLYSRQRVREYWIVDWREETIQVFRRRQAALELTVTLTSDDDLSSPLLEGFTYPIRELFRVPGA